MELHERLSLVEAKLEILQVVAAYGPAVDAGRAQAVADLFAGNGRYSYSLGDEPAHLAGRADLVGMVNGPMHQEIITGGAGHVMGLPHVVIDGHRAVATGHSMLTRFDAETGRWYLDRISANRWELEWTEAGWKVVNRINDVLDGRENARGLLGSAEQTDAWQPAGTRSD